MNCKDSSHVLLEFLHIRSVDLIDSVSKLILIYKILIDYTASSLRNSFDRRIVDHVIITIYVVEISREGNFSKNKIIFSGAMLWNQLSNEAKLDAESILSFKKLIRK